MGEKFYSHPDFPATLEVRGNHVVRNHPSGATSESSFLELLALQILIKLELLVEGRKFAIASENPVASVLKAAEEVVGQLDAEQAEAIAQFKEKKSTRGK